MAPRKSPLYQFILDALVCKTYPSCLYWVDAEKGIFCLECIAKNKKGCTPVHSKIFEDYHKLKSRKSDEIRQRFLVAMKVCPLIKFLKEISSSQKKYYEFSKQGTLPDNTANECNIQLASEMDVDLETTESESSIGDENINSSVGDSHMENDLDNCSTQFLAEDIALSESPNLQDSDDVIEAYNLNNIDVDLGFLDHLGSAGESSDQGTASDIDLLMKQIQNHENYSVPDIVRSINNEAHASLFNENMNFGSSSCIQPPDISDKPELGKEETSYSFVVEEKDAENYPPDYDPVKDFIQSLIPPKPAGKEINSIVIPNIDPCPQNMQMAASASRDFPKYEIAKVSRIDANDDIAKRLGLGGPNAKDNPKKYYILDLKTKQM